MCHSTVFWYTCDHLIPTDTICPFKETLIDHTKTTTKTAYVEDACCLCKQPCSPTVESLRANLISVQKLTSVIQLESRDGHFPEEVTRFFATGKHLQWKHPGAGATPATPVPGPATAPIQALTPSPTVVDASPSKTRRASAAQNKKSPSASKSRQSPMSKQSPQNKQSLPTPQMSSSPTNQPKPQNTQPTPETTLSPSDSLVAEALNQWERESSDPDNDFTTVNFDAIKSVCELEEQIRLGYLPRGSQIDGSLTVSVGVEFQHDTQTQASHHHHPQHGLPLSLQQGTPYDGTNWGQEGVYLPSENYYFVGDKAQATIEKGQVPLPLSAMDPLNEQQSFSTYTTLDVDDSDAQSVNKYAQEQQHYYIERPSAPVPAPFYFPQSMPIPYEQTQQSPVTHLSPKEIHNVTTSPSRSKAKSKAKSAAPSVTIVNGSNTTEHNTAQISSTARDNTTTTTKRTSKNNTAKDPTKGIKDSSSRVTKQSSTPSSGNKKSSKANTKNATTTEQQQHQQQQPSSRKQWVSIPRPPPEAIIVPQSTQQQLQYTMPSMLPCF